MREFSTPEFFAFAQQLHGLEWQAFTLKGSRSGPITVQDVQIVNNHLKKCREVAKFFWLPVTEQKIRRVEGAISAPCADDELQGQLKILNETITDELQGRLVFFMPANQGTRYYIGPRLLGDAVATRFPLLSTDIGEAAKCLSMARYTATVFHLMRVMEAGVRERPWPSE